MMEKKEEENWKYLTKAEMQSKEKRSGVCVTLWKHFSQFVLHQNILTVS